MYINQILLTMKLSVKIVLEDKNINIYKIDNDGQINIELCSGFEKSIIDFAIRLCLIKISRLHKCDFYVLDECFSYFDNNNINN